MFHYLATPYTHPDASVRQKRVDEARRYMAALLSVHVITFCPVSMTHDAAVTFDLPKDFRFWERFNHAFLERSAGVVVADMGGWEQSAGVMHEIQTARFLGLPVSIARFDGDRITVQKL
jgi:hypothetical protein